MIWYILSFISINVLLALIYLLVQYPDATLLYFWNGLIPLVPMILFFSVGFWRNICPLGALSQVPYLTHLSFKMKFPDSYKRWSFYIAFFSLFMFVVGRKITFNTDANTLLYLIGALGVTALVSGILFTGKSGWCTSICPIYPVERLYGQEPLVDVKNCFIAEQKDGCVKCTTRCFDKVSNNTFMHDLNGTHADQETRKHRKIFAGMFPGFIFGYFIVPNYPIKPIFDIYTEIFLFSMITYSLFNIIYDKFSKTGEDTLMTIFGAMALNIYYYFTIPNSLHLFMGNNENAFWIGGTLQFIIFALTMSWIADMYKREHKKYIRI